MVRIVPDSVREEAAARYEWTGWVWGLAGWSSRLHKNDQLFDWNL